MSLAPGAQQVCTVFLQISPTDPSISLFLDTFVIAHSEDLEPDIPLANLSIYFQYIKIDGNLESEVLIVNHTDDLIHYRARKLEGHIEKIK